MVVSAGLYAWDTVFYYIIGLVFSKCGKDVPCETVLIQRGKRLKVICLVGSYPLEVLEISMLDRLMDVSAVDAEDE